MNQKKCTNCRVDKDLSEFHRATKAKDGRASWCKFCANTIHRKYRKRNYSKENKRKWQLKTRYGLTPNDVDDMLGAQGGKCALCPTILKKPHIDHCHNTGKVRGLLCHRCNIRLGGWDDINWRDRAARYLGLSVSAPLSEVA